MGRGGETYTIDREEKGRTEMKMEEKVICLEKEIREKGKGDRNERKRE